MDRAQVVEAARLAGLSLPEGLEFQVDGADPIIASPFRFGEGAATMHTLLGGAASALWKLKTGRLQQVRVSVPHAAASLRSGSFTRVDGPEAETIFPPMAPRPDMPSSGLFECGDGRWVHLQSEFPHLVSGLISFLGCENTRESIAAAVKRWKAQDLEDALAERKLCGVMARDLDEWLAHPQGQILAKLPAVEIERIGDAPVEPMPPGDRPLSGVRVLDATRVLAGPTCARTLAEHGADVLHVASPHLYTFQMTELDTGLGKRQALLDLRDPAGQQTMRDLLVNADVFSQSFRAGKMDALGWSPEAAAKTRPGIIYVSVNCFGHHGPWRDRPGWEQLAQTATGVVNRQGTRQQPSVTGAAANDYTTGYFAAYGVMEALRRRATEGGSWHVKASLCQTSMWYYRLGAVCDPAEAAGIDGSGIVETHESRYGKVEHLKPVVQLSETPARWTLPSEPLGTHTAEWLPR